MYELLNFVDGIENKIVFGETFGSKTKFTYRWFSLFQRNALLFASKSKLNHWRSLPIWKLKNSIRKYNWIFNSPKHWRVLIPSFLLSSSSAFCLLPYRLCFYMLWVTTLIGLLPNMSHYHPLLFGINTWRRRSKKSKETLRALGWVITHFFAKFF